MKNVYLFIVCISLFSAAQANVPFQQREDSLLSALKATPDARKQIELYQSLAAMFCQEPKEVAYAKAMAQTAEKNKSYPDLYEAWSILSRYYYKEENKDSLSFWVNRIDSLASLRGETPDRLFDTKSFICQVELWDGNYELAMNDAIRLYNQAKDARGDYGLVCCNENRGLIYQEINRDSDAVAAYAEGLAKLREIGGHKPYQMQFMGNLAESYLDMGQLEQLEQLLEEYNAMLTELEQENRSEGKSFPVDRTRCLIQTFYSRLYTFRNKKTKALQALHIAKPLMIKVEDGFITFNYYYAQALYDNSVGKYEEALQALDKIKEDYKLGTS